MAEFTYTQHRDAVTKILQAVINDLSFGVASADLFNDFGTLTRSQQFNKNTFYIQLDNIEFKEFRGSRAADYIANIHILWIRPESINTDYVKIRSDFESKLMEQFNLAGVQYVSPPKMISSNIAFYEDPSGFLKNKNLENRIIFHTIWQITFRQTIS